MRGQAPAPCTHAGTLLWHPGSDLAESTTPVPVGRTGFTAFAPPRGERWRPCGGGSPRTWGEPRDEPCGGSRCLRCPGTGPNRGRGPERSPTRWLRPECLQQPGGQAEAGRAVQVSAGSRGRAESRPPRASFPSRAPRETERGRPGWRRRPQPAAEVPDSPWWLGVLGSGRGPCWAPSETRPGPGVCWAAAAPGGQSAGLSGRGAAGPGGDPRERGGGQRTPAGRGTVWKFLACSVSRKPRSEGNGEGQPTAPLRPGVRR